MIWCYVSRGDKVKLQGGIRHDSPWIWFSLAYFDLECWSRIKKVRMKARYIDAWRQFPFIINDIFLVKKLSMTTTFLYNVLSNYRLFKCNSSGHEIEFTGESLGPWAFFLVSFDRTYKIIIQLLFICYIKIWKTKTILQK